jgi:hypothetical protein
LVGRSVEPNSARVELLQWHTLKLTTLVNAVAGRRWPDVMKGE